jgi:hypothetical protein
MKYLKVNEGVIVTPIILPVIESLDKYFKKAKITAIVTSGLRTSEDQLRIIKNYLSKKGLSHKYPETFSKELHDKIKFNGKEVYSWQPGWSALLNAGIIINPPIPAECLMDYIRGGVNKKGKIINASPHFNGTAFDIGGGADGIEGPVTNELAVVQKALKDKLPGLKGIVIERNNNCIHCDCIKIQ